MKKLIFCVVLTVVICCVVACVNITDEVAPYVDYVEDGLATAEIDGYAIEWVVGVKDNERMGQVRLYPLYEGGIDKEITLTCDGVSYEMKKSDKRYALECKTSTGAIPESASFSVDGVEIVVEPKIITVPTSADKALSIAAEHFSDELKDVLDDTSPVLEGKVKIVPDRLGGLPYYYYVSFRSDQVKLACMIDPISGVVVASEKN